MTVLDDFRALHDLTGGWHYIYTLIDPRNGELRYIGKSDRPLQRLRDHINERSNTHRSHWIQQLAALGLEPEIEIIDATPAGTDWQMVEIAYIAAARGDGIRLVNGTNGGDGVTGLSPESRARITNAWRGRKHTPETLMKLSVARKGRKIHTPEWLAYMSKKMAEREFSPEHRQRIREAVQKLTPADVRAIRRLLKAGMTQREVANQFGIHQGSVSNIARRKTYADVPEEDR